MSGDAKGKDIATKRLRKASKTPNPPRKSKKAVMLEQIESVPLRTLESERIRIGEAAARS